MPAKTETRHTPGPWRMNVQGAFSDDGKPTASVWIESGPFCSLAVVMPVPEVEANARLIASAPDLLDAAKAVLDCCARMGESPAWTALTAAIAKAEGYAR